MVGFTKKITLVFIAFLLSTCTRSFHLEPPLTHNRTEIIPTGNVTEIITTISERERSDTLVVETLPKANYTKEWKSLSPLPPSKGIDNTAEEEKTDKRLDLDPDKLVGVKKPVLLNVENMPLSEFIIYVLGELLKVPFLIDEEVRNLKKLVTLRIPEPLPPQDILMIVADYLTKQELSVEQRGKVLSITKKRPKPLPSPLAQRTDSVIIGEEVPDTPANIVLFYPLKYTRPSEIDYILKDIFKSGIDIKLYPKENALYMTGPGSQIRRVLEVIKILDIPAFVDKKLHLLKVNYLDVETLNNQMNELFMKIGFPVAKNIKEPGILFIPLKSINSLLIASPDDESFRFVLEWAKRLDTPDATGVEERFFVYRPRYTMAKDLAELLQHLLTGYSQSVQTMISTTSPSPQTSPQASPIHRPTPKVASVAGKGYVITADEKRNVLIIYAPTLLYENINRLLQELDRPSRQVLIEATILELSLRDELKMGFEWFIKNRMGGNFTLFQKFGIPLSPGLTYTFIGDTEKFNLIINLFAEKRLMNILSTPRLLVLDNQEAIIQVGEDVPIVTGEVATVQGATANATGIVRSIQYRSTGIILKVRPTIFADDMLQLNIIQEISEMGTSPPGLASPVISVRKVSSNILAGSGQSIVLGGLISSTGGKAESKVPILGDIPILGNLFKSQIDNQKRTELLILLRPYILKNLEEAQAITNELKERLKWLK